VFFGYFTAKILHIITLINRLFRKYFIYTGEPKIVKNILQFKVMTHQTNIIELVATKAKCVVTSSVLRLLNSVLLRKCN